MAQKSFTATIDAWVSQTKERMLAVRNESAQRIVEIMQTPRGRGGNLRVDTGFLRSSLRATVGDFNFAMTTNPNPDAPKGSLDTYDSGAISLVIAGADINDVLHFGYTANYARPREYGARGQEGDRFVALAAQQWQRVVSEVATELQTRSGG